MKKEKSAGAVIFCMKNDKIKFLLLKYTNYWGFAKGWMEEGESEEQTAIREIKEETNLENVKIIPGFQQQQKWMYRLNEEWRDKEAVFFLVEVNEEQAKKVKISDEHEDFKWLEKDEAVKIMRIKQNKEMLKKADEFILESKKQRKLI